VDVKVKIQQKMELVFATLTPKQRKQADTNGGFQMISRRQSYQESIVCGPGGLYPKTNKMPLDKT
jgi:pyridoxine 5'-phosphate synthase PdxJ